MLGNKEVTWFPSYGAEIRGGTANCAVIVSDELIGSPVVTNPDILIVMNEASLKKFQAGLRQKGLLIFDSSLIKDPELRTDIEIVGVPATEIAYSIGNAKSANMVLLGVFIAKTKLLEKNYVFDALESTVPDRRKKSIGVNKNAFIEGMKFIEDKKG